MRKRWGGGGGGGKKRRKEMKRGGEKNNRIYVHGHLSPESQRLIAKVT